MLDIQLPHLEKLPIGDVPVIVDIVYSEGEFELAVLVPLDTELGHSLDELLEVDFTVAVVVKNFCKKLKLAL